MTRLLGIGGPKGGVGKTTLALNLATHTARELRARVLLVDADPNRSAIDAAVAAGEAMPFDVTAATDAEQLAQLCQSPHDVVLFDLPGTADSAALDVLLTGGCNGVPLIDGLALPSRPELMDLRPLLPMIDDRIRPAGLDYRIALLRVHRDRTGAARRRRTELRGLGYKVAQTYTRALVAHDDALEVSLPVCDLTGGRHSAAAAATREYRELAPELLALGGGHQVRSTAQCPRSDTEASRGHPSHAC